MRAPNDKLLGFVTVVAALVFALLPRLSAWAFSAYEISSIERLDPPASFELSEAQRLADARQRVEEGVQKALRQEYSEPPYGPNGEFGNIKARVSIDQIVRVDKPYRLTVSTRIGHFPADGEQQAPPDQFIGQTFTAVLYEFEGTIDGDSLQVRAAGGDDGPPVCFRGRITLPLGPRDRTVCPQTLSAEKPHSLNSNGCRELSCCEFVPGPGGVADLPQFSGVEAGFEFRVVEGSLPRLYERTFWGDLPENFSPGQSAGWPEYVHFLKTCRSHDSVVELERDFPEDEPFVLVQPGDGFPAAIDRGEALRPLLRKLYRPYSKELIANYSLSFGAVPLSQLQRYFDFSPDPFQPLTRQQLVHFCAYLREGKNFLLVDPAGSLSRTEEDPDPRRLRLDQLEQVGWSRWLEH
jgi:hypothetical protein